MTEPNPPAAPAGPAPAPTAPQFTPPSDPAQPPSGPTPPTGTPPPQQPASGPQGGDQRPPWERDGEPFDPERAWKRIQALEADRDQARAKRDEHKSALDEIERGKLSAQQQAEADRDSYKTRAEAAEWELARHDVLARKGLQPAAAEFLTGSTREELEASADRLLAWNPAAALAAAAPAVPPIGPAALGRPAEALTVPAGGSDPSSQLGADDLDPVKLASRIPRGIR